MPSPLVSSLRSRNHMDSSIAPSPAGKRGRNSSAILTDRMCEKRVARRTKLYDRKCPGLYVSITTAGVATFSFKFTDRETGKQRTGWLGVYNAETFTVEDARSKVYGLKSMGGEALAETFRDQKTAKAQRGKTVAEIIDERIAWMKTLVKKPDGEMRPRLESWQNTASHLDRLIRPRLGKKLAMEVTKHDIATLSNDIVAGKFGKPSVSNARHMRKAASGLFNWAAEAGRDYVTASPCGQTKTPALSRRARNPTTDDLNRDDYEERSKQSATITWQSDAESVNRRGLLRPAAPPPRLQLAWRASISPLSMVSVTSAKVSSSF